MIRIVVDSCSSMTLDEANKRDIKIVPMKYELNGKELNPLEDNIDIKEFYDMILNHDVNVKTSCVSPDDYRIIFEEAIKNNEEVLYIALSKGLSGSYNSAQLAKNIILDDYPDAKIEIINSLSGSLGVKLIIDEALILVNEGKSLSEIVDILNSYAKRAVNTFTIGSLYHLYKGGRLKYTAMMAGRLLHFKPVISTNSEGSLEKSGTFIGKNKAISAMEDTLDKTIDTSSKSIYIGYTNNIDEANKLKNKLEAKYPSLNIIAEPIDKTMGCHCGPETIALFYFHK